MTVFKNQNIALDKLTRSADNVRAVGKTRDVAKLADSIAAQGLIQPLVVHKCGAGFAVAAGGRRLAALQLLSERGDWSDPVPCRVIDKAAGDDLRAAISFAENDGQLPMHPLDRMRIMQQFVRKGWDANKIATRFGLPVKDVTNALTLSKLALPVRRAFAEGDIELEDALVFASCSDTTRQVEVFSNDYWYSPASLRAKLHGQHAPGKRTMTERSRFFSFIGAEAYEGEGGSYVQDLFTEQGERKVNGELVVELAKAKLAEDADDYKSDAMLDWVMTSLYERPEIDGLFRWEDDVDLCPVETGGVVWIGFRGQLGKDGPFVRIADYEAWEASQRSASDDAEAIDTIGSENPEVEQEPEIDPDTLPKAPSRAMNEDAGAALTGALSAAISQDFGTAFDLILSSFLSEGLNRFRSGALIRNVPGVSFTPEWEALRDETGAFPDDTLAYVTDLPEAEKQRLFAVLVGGMVQALASDFTGHAAQTPRAQALDVAARLDVNMHAEWTADDRRAYLDRMTKHDLACHVIGLEGDALQSTIASSSKSALVDRAMDQHWLPAYFDGCGDPADHPGDETTMAIAAE